MFRLISESHPTRCEICHQSDLFLPEQNQCLRCRQWLGFQSVKAQSSVVEYLRKLVRSNEPPPRFMGCFEETIWLMSIFLCVPCATLGGVFGGDFTFSLGYSPFWGSLTGIICAYLNYKGLNWGVALIRLRQWKRLNLQAKTCDELRAMVRDHINQHFFDLVKYLLVLLQDRGEDIQPEFGLILEMLCLEEISARYDGWFILGDLYLEEACKLDDYNPGESVDVCLAKIHKAFPEFTLKNEIEIQKDNAVTGNTISN